MPCIRKCQISDVDFGGFQIFVDIDYYYSTNEISDYVKNKLLASLNQLHLGLLITRLYDKKFHIHDKSIYDIRNEKNDGIIYICGHC